jgi:hypothetical protein
MRFRRFKSPVNFSFFFYFFLYFWIEYKDSVKDLSFITFFYKIQICFLQQELRKKNVFRHSSGENSHELTFIFSELKWKIQDKKINQNQKIWLWHIFKKLEFMNKKERKKILWNKTANVIAEMGSMLPRWNCFHGFLAYTSRRWAKISCILWPPCIMARIALRRLLAWRSQCRHRGTVFYTVVGHMLSRVFRCLPLLSTCKGFIQGMESVFESSG